MSDATFTLPSYAKINLTLRVHGRRADGYHEIETVFQTITLHDELTFSALDRAQFELTCVGDAPAVVDIPCDETNLVYRAGIALRERFGVNGRGARVELSKKIPSGGGLGGGSSNAAVALVGLARLWEIETDRPTLSEIGASLGADVPFFLTGGTALGTGRGTDISPLRDAPHTHLLVVTPNVKVSTAEAYQSLDAPALTKPISPVNLTVSRTQAEISGSLRAALANDFERIVYRLHPEIERARDALMASGASGALLSGSGASVYGLFGSARHSESAQASLKVEAGWQVFACTTLSRRAYEEAFGAGKF
ncbi:MAG TPA: 4-(cytidine 5'-diphospho)-2-C-methyl-D-erythritol kinase [Pyrinomonadaceae bacterium]|nr:4-(cytidine 5'-diphospho)-2-C-methyl-D-erythritol kinase [Pyrinomonadaceae bacterium]